MEGGDTDMAVEKNNKTYNGDVDGVAEKEKQNRTTQNSENSRAQAQAERNSENRNSRADAHVQLISFSEYVA